MTSYLITLAAYWRKINKPKKCLKHISTAATQKSCQFCKKKKEYKFLCGIFFSKLPKSRKAALQNNRCIFSYVKRVPFFQWKVYQKGGLFCQKWYMGLDLGWSSLYETLLSSSLGRRWSMRLVCHLGYFCLLCNIK